MGRQTPERVEELVKIFIQGTKVSNKTTENSPVPRLCKTFAA